MITVNTYKGCKDYQGGIEKVYLFPFEKHSRTEITTIGEYLTIFPSTTIFETYSSTSNYSEPTEIEGGSVLYKQSLSMQVPKTLATSEIPTLVDQRYRAIYVDNIGNIRILGLYNGLDVEVTNETGSERNSLNGWKVSLSGKEDHQAYYLSDFSNFPRANTLYNGVSAMYTLRRPAMSTLWTNAVMYLRRSSDDQGAWVFFDGDDINDTITLSSFISTGSSSIPSTTTLGDWIGANDAYVRNFHAIKGDNILDSDMRLIQPQLSSQPKFITGGVIESFNGKPAIDFLSVDQIMSADINTDLDNGNSFTIASVSQNPDTNTIDSILTSGTNASGLRFDHVNDRRTNKVISNIKTADGAFLSTNISQQDISNQKLLTSIVENNNLKGYYNGVFQSTIAYTDTYLNTSFTVGRSSDRLTYMTGHFQELIVFPSDITEILPNIHEEINLYYNIYI